MGKESKTAEKSAEQAQAPKAKSLNIAKITTKELGFTKKVLEELVIKNDGKTIPIVRVVGNVTTVEPKESDDPNMEDSLLFRGIFKGVNLLTGISYVSSKMYLPPTIQDALGSVFQQEGVTNIIAKFDITVTRSQKEKGSAYIFGWDNHTNDVDTMFDALEQGLPPAPDIKLLGLNL